VISNELIAHPTSFAKGSKSTYLQGNKKAAIESGF
jgi:hypothetical protein